MFEVMMNGSDKKTSGELSLLYAILHDAAINDPGKEEEDYENIH